VHDHVGEGGHRGEDAAVDHDDVDGVRGDARLGEQVVDRREDDLLRLGAAFVQVDARRKMWCSAGGRLVSSPRPLRSSVRSMKRTPGPSKNGMWLTCSTKVETGKRQLGGGRKQA
jgi:hypothetical protein